ncbi:aminotransferase class V-fold PLP-dependent enzyme [Corynebacterium tapiri]|uniref:Aminotransferase class V-fold PLP-dependent enzyme n=1 Tax=Corynebacterium tapiri TaxID=1448266 RepID=A0A5C4U3B9_9CORY|nr:aminotransferase class V-fold PLP-dependent enzyme [Corynebacterium tapiri]TNL97407.1 aminotransferase class V-fold PLP-dependent enzyme [Corynebacterium tapiri]
MSSYDVFGVRGLYTSLGDGWTYLNAHSCPQVPERVVSAVGRSFRLSAAVTDPEETGHHARHWGAGTPEGDRFVHQARVAVADLAGVRPECVVLGPSLEVLYANLARALGPRLLGASSSVVLRSSDSPALTAPFTGWRSQVRWAHADLGTGEVPGFQYEELVDGSTRLVALSAAEKVLGSVTDVASVVEKVRARSRAWVLVDASSFVPYRRLDMAAWGADIVSLDLAEMGGPQVAALIFRDRLMFNRLADFAGRSGAAALDSPISTGLAGGVTAVVDHMASLVESAGNRRHQLSTSMTALEQYLGSLADDMYLFLGSLPAVHVIGVTGEAAAGATTDRLPRLSFAVQGVPAETVQRRLVANRLITTLTPITPLTEHMGVAEIGGAVTVGLGPFNTNADLEHLVRVVASLA